MAAHLGAREDGPPLTTASRRFRRFRDAAERAVARAAEAGRVVNDQSLLDVLLTDTCPAVALLAGNLFFRLLGRLGVASL